MPCARLSLVNIHPIGFIINVLSTLLMTSFSNLHLGFCPYLSYYHNILDVVLSGLLKVLANPSNLYVNLNSTLHFIGRRGFFFSFCSVIAYTVSIESKFALPSPELKSQLLCH